MLISVDFKIKIMKYNIEHYINMGYDVKIGDITIIKAEDLIRGSTIPVIACCDVCGVEKTLLFRDYYKNYNNQKTYVCIKHKGIKTKKTCLEKYGVDNVALLETTKTKKKKTCLEKYGVEYYLQSVDKKEKDKKTCLKKYGVEYYLQSNNKKEKTKNSCLKKYGVEHHTQTDEYKEKIKDKNIEKYGVVCSLQSKSVIEKSKKTYLEKYGVDHYSKTDEYKEKIKSTCTKRYGVEHYSKTDEFNEKIKKTSLKRFGVEHYFLSDIFKESIKKILIKKYGVDNYFKYYKFKMELRNKLIEDGFNVCSDNIKDFSKYKRNCITLSHSNYKKLYEIWDGYDYYDDKYIKENLLLNSNDRLYPTVDHKNSILYGYLNNISIENISNIDNLCITKRYINSMKNSKTEEDFIDKFKKK